MSKKIRLHKEINRLPIVMEKETAINVFYGLLELYNRESEYKDLYLTRQILWDLTGISGNCNTVHLRELIGLLTKSNTYEVSHLNIDGIKSIGGSIFVVTEYLLENKIKIAVPEDFRKFLFYKTDIDLMTKAKKNKKMSIAELDHYDKMVKPKSKYLMLLKKADLLGISGKYSKRLYALLMQFNKTLKFWMEITEFRRVLEIPDSYRMCDIDQQILTPAKKELLKHNLKIKKIKKIKKGRTIDKIEVYFTVKTEEKKEKKEIKKIEKIEILDTIVVLKAKLIRGLGKINKLNLIVELEKINSLEGIKEFKNRYDL